MSTYFARIWDARYFWVHLALADLRARWRRSFLGVAWSVIQPLGMTLLLALVFSKLFNTNIVSYAPYILSGIIVWEFISANTVAGSLSFVQADAYIKQCNHPLAIYTLRTVIGSVIVLMLASLSLYGWAAVVLPQNIGWCWLASLTLYPILCLIAWPVATLLSYISSRFRDIPHALGLVMQSLWFISPVYFEEKMFRRGGLDALVDYNPVYHILQLIRAPLLNGEWPTMDNYLFSVGTACLFALIALLVGRRVERKVIFYL
ncbi:ABC transporter permease [Pseudomonas agarici]|uniref:Transport permease protein n=1 Tax=Pseudomonas agarici TaxID=46677 RepID=A0A0X1T611_PSEAA|nr:ABC transporter permease [Pseudomonas agarici]AMB87546.1 ABC transporter permease [Pseudomonas agarici]NWB90055.1 ABC transporter permease [Pseudomonas agarici]NWC08167.1 ABC transporter permease [Pseudomonas agarici]SEK85035.1 lipopolysaccharide transport system permease protein [Pseudomonas agarici]